MEKKVVIDPMAIPPHILKLTSPEHPDTKQPTVTAPPTATRRSTYVSNIISTSGPAVSMPNNFLWPLDGYHVWLYGTSSDAGTIIGEMSAQVSIGTKVCVKAFSGGNVADTSVMEVYVSNNPYGSWVQVLSVTVPKVPVSSYYFNAPTGGFKYISVRGHNNSNYSDLYVDGAETV
jgi:hypothetical protein